MSETELLSLEEVMEILGLPRATVEHWVEKGTLIPVLIDDHPRFHPQDVRRVYEEEEFEKAQRKKRILVIDDEPLVGRSLKGLLERAGYEITAVTMSLAALDLVVREFFDLVVIDIRMPGMNGIQTIKAVRDLRSQFGKRPIPEIVITGYDEEPVREEAKRMGIKDFILKPFEAGTLLTAVRKNLGEREVSLRL